MTITDETDIAALREAQAAFEAKALGLIDQQNEAITTMMKSMTQLMGVLKDLADDRAISLQEIEDIKGRLGALESGVPRAVD